jgi:hypothetical protein
MPNDLLQYLNKKTKFMLKFSLSYQEQGRDFTEL